MTLLFSNDGPNSGSPHREIWTIGHSNRSFEEFAALLRDAEIACVADVRRFNGSRRHPQFSRDAFEPALVKMGFSYIHFEALGGRRSRRGKDSLNTAWRVASFNAYADHMATAEFRRALDALTILAESKRVAIMCSEALPWRCHRRLVADALVVRGWTVHDIVGRGKTSEHHLPEFARVADGQITYPGESDDGGSSEGHGAPR
jgi:uncharacterized protein (DUF488 family)